MAQCIYTPVHIALAADTHAEKVQDWPRCHGTTAQTALRIRHRPHVRVKAPGSHTGVSLWFCALCHGAQRPW